MKGGGAFVQDSPEQQKRVTRRQTSTLSSVALPKEDSNYIINPLWNLIK
jgi:hypothetical protein